MADLGGGVCFGVNVPRVELLFFILNYLDIGYRVELNVLIVDLHGRRLTILPKNKSNLFLPGS